MRTQNRKHLGRDVRGSTAAEYVVIVACVALAALGAYGLLGDAIDHSVRCAAESIGGVQGAHCGAGGAGESGAAAGDEGAAGAALALSRDDGAGASAESLETSPPPAGDADEDAGAIASDDRSPDEPAPPGTWAHVLQEFERAIDARVDAIATAVSPIVAPLEPWLSGPAHVAGTLLQATGNLVLALPLVGDTVAMLTAHRTEELWRFREQLVGGVVDAGASAIGWAVDVLGWAGDEVRSFAEDPLGFIGGAIQTGVDAVLHLDRTVLDWFNMYVDAEIGLAKSIWSAIESIASAHPLGRRTMHGTWSTPRVETKGYGEPR